MSKPDATAPANTPISPPALADTPAVVRSEEEVALAAAVDTPEASERKRWKKALIIVGNHRIPADNKRPVIIVESRTFKIEDGNVTGTELKTSGYPAGGDLYFRTTEEVEFPKDAKVLTLGDNVQQGLLWGFSPDPRWVNVGPAYPAYAAANIAWQRGAEEIEIIGLSDHEKERLAPFIAALPAGGPAPVDGAPDVRTPADVEITLT